MLITPQDVIFNAHLTLNLKLFSIKNPLFIKSIWRESQYKVHYAKLLLKQ